MRPSRQRARPQPGTGRPHGRGDRQERRLLPQAPPGGLHRPEGGGLRLRPRSPHRGGGRAGAVAAVTSGDNSNILTARIARENFAIDRVVARIYDPRRALIYQRLGIPTVATVSWTTDQVMRRLLPAEDQPHEWLDPSGKVCLLDYPLPAKWAGKKLAPLSE